MLSPTILSTYQQYKQDTAAIASWLAVTAKHHGYDAQIGDAVTTGLSKKKQEPNKAGRPKGKARQQAKQKQKQLQTLGTVSDAITDNASYPHAAPKYVLAIRDFVPLAEFITSRSCKNVVEIPSLISKALERAIRARKTSLQQFGEVKLDQDTQSNEMHAHFVSVLEQVSVLLLGPQAAVPVVASMLSRNQTETTAVQDGFRKKARGQGQNLFGVLQADEPSEAFLNAPDVASSAGVTYEFQAEEEDSITECIFAFVALLGDLFILREEVGSLWKEYIDGKIDLAAAATGANMAVELARTMEDDISPLLNKYGGSAAMLSAVFIAVCKNLDLDPFQKARPSDDMSFYCYKTGATFLHNALVLLTSMRTAAPSGKHSLPLGRYNGKFGWYDAQTADFTAQDSQLWAQDKAALMDVIPDIAMLFELKGIPVQDEFACGVKAMFDTQQIPLWLCFAAQNYLDTLHLFGPAIVKPVAELHRFNEINADLVQKVLVTDPKNVVREELEQISAMVKLEALGMDIFTVSWSLGVDKHNENSSRPSFFLQHNPLFCGLWMNFIRVLLHNAGVQYMAKPGVALHTVQLYEAVRQHQQEHNSLVVTKWPEIECLISMQGRRAFFVGSEPPSTPEAHFKHYCLSRGVSPTNWLPTSARRKGKRGEVPVKMSQAGHRELHFLAPMSHWCAGRIGKLGRVNTEVVYQVMHANRWSEKSQGKSEDKSNTSTGLGSDFGPIEGEEAKGGQYKAKGKLASPVLSMADIVSHVAYAVQDELADLEFNYFDLHQAADGLLRWVRDNADDMGLPQELCATKDIVDVVGVVFAVVAGRVTSGSGEAQNLLGRIGREM